MGAYLDKPVREKESGEGGNARFTYGFSSMQGWRRTQEDAHAAVVDLDGENKPPVRPSRGEPPPAPGEGPERAPNLGSDAEATTGFFAVYDGHGGAAVARFCARHLHGELLRSEAYARGDMAGALQATYMRMDELMKTRSAELELKELAKITPMGTSITVVREEDENGDGEETVVELSEEMQMELIESGEGEGGMGEVVAAMLPAAIMERLRTGSLKSTSNVSLSVESTPMPGAGAGGIGAAGEVGASDDAAADATGSEKKRQRAGGAADEHGAEREDGEGKRACQVAADEDDESMYATPPSNIVATANDPIPPTTGGLVQGPAAGCTAVAAVVHGQSLTVANCGDSRCVLSRGGTAVALSRDHKPDDPTEAARIEAAKCFVSDGRVNGVLNLSRAIGDSEFKQAKDVPAAEQAVTANPEIMTQTLRLAPGEADECADAPVPLDEFLVLGCDGIFDVKSNQEVVDFVRRQLAGGASEREACEALLDDCLSPDCGGSGVGCDNMSAVIVTFGPQGEGFPKGCHAARLGETSLHKGDGADGGSGGAGDGDHRQLTSTLSIAQR